MYKYFIKRVSMGDLHKSIVAQCNELGIDAPVFGGQ